MNTTDIKLFSMRTGRELKDNDKPPSSPEELFVLNILEYKNRKFTSDQITKSKKGYYELTQEDVYAIEYSLDLFWSYMFNNTGIRDIFAIREAVGKRKDEVKGKKVGYKMFFPSKVGLDSINVTYVDSFESIVNPIPRIDNKYIEKIKIMIFYANSLGGSIDEFLITSTRRTPEQQADIMIRDYFSINKRGLYGSSETIYFENLENEALGDLNTRKAIARTKLIENIDRQKHNSITGPGFHHTNPNYTIVDIDPNSIASPSQFEQSLAIFKGKYLITYEKPPKDNAYHLVFK